MFNKHLPFTTGDGRKVTVYTLEAPGEYPIHGLIEEDEEPSSWNDIGENFRKDTVDPMRGGEVCKSDDDLVNVEDSCRKERFSPGDLVVLKTHCHDDSPVMVVRKIDSDGDINCCYYDVGGNFSHVIFPSSVLMHVEE